LITQWGRWSATLVLLFGFGCSGPALPKGIKLDGQSLEKAADWSRSGLSGRVFIPPGEKLDTASVQVGVILSEKHTSGRALNTWLMDEYRKSPTTQFFENAADEEACKVGATTNGTEVRLFLALHLCRGRGAYAVCAEVDEKLVDPSGSPCPIDDGACWPRLCEERWIQRRTTLTAIADQVLAY
jgi:hypothetical protein